MGWSGCNIGGVEIARWEQKEDPLPLQVAEVMVAVAPVGAGDLLFPPSSPSSSSSSSSSTTSPFVFFLVGVFKRLLFFLVFIQ